MDIKILIVIFIIVLVMTAIFHIMYHYAMSSEYMISSDIAEDLLELKLAKTIDVRTKTEYDIGHYDSAIHIPASEIDANSTANLNKEDIYIVYCNTGQRARQATDKLRDLDFKYVYYITGTYLSLE